MTADNQYASAADMVAAEIRASMDVTSDIVNGRKQAQSKPTAKPIEDSPSSSQKTRTLREEKSSSSEEDAASSESRKRSKNREKAKRLQEDRWVPARFRIRESKEYALHQIYYQRKLTGDTSVTQQELVDEALEWLLKKYS